MDHNLQREGNKVRTESYDLKNNLSLITVYGYLDGARVSAINLIPREYGPRIGSGGGGVRSNKPMDPRYNRRFEYKYDEKNRLTERTEFSVTVIFRGVTCTSTKGTKRGAALHENGSLNSRRVEVLDDKGNPIEATVFDPDGSVVAKTSHSYEFDSHGSWIKRTSTTTNGVKSPAAHACDECSPPHDHLQLSLTTGPAEFI